MGQLGSELDINRVLPPHGKEVLGDMAMIKLERALRFTDGVQPVCLPPPGFDISVNFPETVENNGPVCTIAGWGDTKGTGDSNILHQAALPVNQFKLSVFTNSIYLVAFQ